MQIEENDNRTPRERIDDSFLRRMLGEGEQASPRENVNHRGGLPCNPQNQGLVGHGLSDFPLGMVYSPIQEWRNAYDVQTALERGTLFRDLDKPWEVAPPTIKKGGFCCD